MTRREDNEEGLFYYIKEYLKDHSHNDDELKLKLEAHQQWNGLSKYMKQQYQKKYKDSLDLQVQHQQQQENVTQQIEVQNNNTNHEEQRKDIQASPKLRGRGRGGGRGRRMTSVENAAQAKKQGQSRSVKTRASVAQVKKQKELQKQEEEEEEQLFQRIKDISKSKVACEQKIQLDRNKNDVLNLKKAYNLNTYIQHYKMLIKGKKQHNQ